LPAAGAGQELAARFLEIAAGLIAKRFARAPRWSLASEPPIGEADAHRDRAQRRRLARDVRKSVRICQCHIRTPSKRCALRP